MPVNQPNEEYTAAAERWQTTRDATDGQQAVKGATTRYLPQFIPEDKERYKQYLKFAYYVNVTGRTKRGLVGAVYRKPAEIDLPADLEYLINNANGAGQGLVQISKKTVGECLEVGRQGLLVEYPEAEEGLSREQVIALDLKAYIVSYEAEDIINWATTVINGQEMLSMVVLRETTEKPVDQFTATDETTYRALTLELDDNGVTYSYHQTIYGDEGAQESYIPTKADGSVWREIPFIFPGSEDNTPEIDMSPLFDLANINLAQYRNIADREAALRMFSQMSLHIDTGEMSAETWKDLNPKGVMFGASAAIVTNGGGAVNILQASPTDIASVAIKDKAEEMVSVGARLIDKSGINQTAEAARINAASEMSVLDNIVDNVANAYAKAIFYCGEYMGTNTEGSTFNINREFFDETMTAQDYMALIQLGDAEYLDNNDIEMVLKRQGLKAGES